MTLKALLMVAATLSFAGSAAGPIQELLSEQAKQRYEQLRAHPEQNKDAIAEMAKTTEEFSSWQNAVEADKEKAQQRYSQLSKDDAESLFQRFREVVRKDSVDGLKSDLEAPRGKSGKDKLAEFWKCYWNPDSCTSPS